ncbi:MAG: hypothetical protein JNN15_12990, partial [Blastocatellia bacterium]|nr:hypothetical protein [Blastocatellia bacterium]
LSIEYAMEDFRLVYELLAKPSSSANQFSYGKIFADSDAELFDKVKKRYKLGPELVLAKQQYYFVDSILHEAWKSASNNIARAQKRLAEEAVEEAKKRKKASRSSDGSKTPQKTVE